MPPASRVESWPQLEIGGRKENQIDQAQRRDPWFYIVMTQLLNNLPGKRQALKRKNAKTKESRPHSWERPKTLYLLGISVFAGEETTPVGSRSRPQALRFRPTDGFPGLKSARRAQAVGEKMLTAARCRLGGRVECGSGSCRGVAY